VLPSAGKTDAPHQVLPARVGSKAVEQWESQFYKPENPLLIRLFQPRKRGRPVAEPDMHDGYIKRGDVPLQRQRPQIVEDALRLSSLACRLSSRARHRNEFYSFCSTETSR
jgi:hypothetical protein